MPTRVIRLGTQFGLQPDRFDPVLKNTAGQIPGMKWRQGAWCGAPDAVEAAMKAFQDAGGRLDASNWRESPKPEVRCHYLKLRRYQREGVDFLLHHKHAILADDMGLGKTATAVTAAQFAVGNTNGKVLIVCPNFVRGVWLGTEKRPGEISRWWPSHGKIQPLSGAKGCGIEAQVAVIHYDILHAWAEYLRAWNPDVVIFDEGHLLQNEKSQRSQAARIVSKDAEYRWLLTGTPMSNFPKDLWNAVDTIRPNALGNFFTYGLRYCAGTKKQVTPEKVVWDFSGSSNESELNTRLKHYMLRRLKRDVALQLPPKTRQVINVNVGEGSLAKKRTEIRGLLDATADKKVGIVSELVENHAKSGKKVVCFTWRREVAELITNGMRSAGIPSDCVHGGISAARRGKSVEVAREASQGHVLAATIDSSGTGIDLSYADVVVFAELTWEPHKLLQAESRTHRFGVQNPVLIQYVIADNTQDEVVAATVVSKLDTFEATVGSTGEELGPQLRGKEEDMMVQLYSDMGVV